MNETATNRAAATSRDAWPAFSAAIHIERQALAKAAGNPVISADRNAFAVLANLAAGGTGGNGKGGRTDWHGIASAARRRRDTLQALALRSDGPGNNPEFVAHYRTLRALVQKVEGLAEMNSILRGGNAQGIAA